MRVGRADHAELERVDAQLLLLLQAHLQRAAGVLVRQHLIGLGLQSGDVGLVPGAVVGELVGRRQLRMRLAVALDLRDLVQRLPAHAGLGVAPVDRAAVEALDGEHQPVRQIAVVRDREHAAAGLLLVGVHELPQVLRILRVEGREGQDLAGLARVLLEDDDPVQVARVLHVVDRRPLEADQRREHTRLVELVGGLDLTVPDQALHLVQIDEVTILGDTLGAPEHEGFVAFARLDQVVQ